MFIKQQETFRRQSLFAYGVKQKRSPRFIFNKLHISVSLLSMMQATLKNGPPELIHAA